MRLPVIKTSSPIPIAEQFANSIREQIMASQLKGNERLKPVRVFAEKTSIDPMTVHAAIKVLKAEGLLITAGTKGTFVSANAREILQDQTKTRTKQLLIETFERIQSLGVSMTELKGAASGALKEYEKKAGK